MSVDFNAFCGYGWVFSSEERDNIVMKAITTYNDIEDVFTMIDCYSQDGEYFLGTIIGGADAGTAEAINLQEFLDATKDISDYMKYLIAADYDHLWIRENPPSFYIGCRVS